MDGDDDDADDDDADDEECIYEYAAAVHDHADAADDDTADNEDDDEGIKNAWFKAPWLKPVAMFWFKAPCLKPWVIPAAGSRMSVSSVGLLVVLLCGNVQRWTSSRSWCWTRCYFRACSMSTIAGSSPAFGMACVACNGVWA